MFGRIVGGLALISLAALVLACGDDDTSQTSTPTPSGPTASNGTASCPNDLLTEQPLLRMYGGFATDYLADRFSLASGDFNADGFDDALIGAPLADGPNDERLNSGEAYVVFGGDFADSATRLDASSYDEFVVYGADPQDNLGLSVAAADVNGDGIDDVLVGARFASPHERGNTGETYVIFGRSGLSGAVDTSSGGADVTISGIEPGDFSGIIVAGGDVTGDGKGDILIGAIAGAGPDNTRSRAGEIYVIEGRDDLPSQIDLTQVEPFATIYGQTREDALPGRLAVADLDGDGRNEVIAGAPQGTPGGNVEIVGAGFVYAIEIPDDGGVIDLSTDDAMLTVRGANMRDSLGYALTVGDVNGDGTDDLIAGARDADGGDRNNAGEVYVIHGGDDLPSTIDLATDEPNARIIGRDRDDSLGFSLAAADFDDDGRADILAGAALAESCDNGRQEAGEIYLISGRLTEGTFDLALEDVEPVLYGAEEGDELGFSLAAGDFDGDGTPEILAGALLADGPENSLDATGEAFVVEATLED